MPLRQEMKCRQDCGACCIAPSISSLIPGMAQGKPANTPCVHLDEHFSCGLFYHESRPKVCIGLQPCVEMCGGDRQYALTYLADLERATQPYKE